MALGHSEIEETDMRRVQLKTSLKRVEESELKDAEKKLQKKSVFFLTYKSHLYVKPLWLISWCFTAKENGDHVSHY